MSVSISTEIIDENIFTEINKNTDGLTDDLTTKQYEDESFESYTSKISKPKNKLNKKFKSISDLTTSKSYSDSFESESSNQISKPSTSLIKKEIYSDSFISLTDSDKTELENFKKLDINELTQLKNKDLVKYIKLKLKLQKESNKIKQILTNEKQIEKLIERINLNLNRNIFDTNDNDINTSIKNSNVKINSFLVNKLKTENMINQIRRDQFKKIEDYGNELKEDYFKKNQLDLELLKRNIYYKTKLTELNRKLINEKYEEHQMNYGSSIILIGKIAGDLPKFSDPPEIVWKRLFESRN